MHWVRDRTGAPAHAIAVGIETPRGILVDTLLEQRSRVFALNPKQLDRFRDRFTAGGAKDDRRDAHVLADSLRTDARAFRPVRADDPLIIELRELSRDEGRPGKSVTLTLDMGLQSFVNSRLASQESASCAVLSIPEGEVLALASHPAFDPVPFGRGLTGQEHRAAYEHQ